MTRCCSFAGRETERKNEKEKRGGRTLLPAMLGKDGLGYGKQDEIYCG